MVMLYQAHKDADRYQPYALVAGLTIATFLAFMHSQPLQSIVLSILPATAIICLGLSSWLHCLARSMSERAQANSVEDKKLLDEVASYAGEYTAAFCNHCTC